jgi:hypothetical protein
VKDLFCWWKKTGRPRNERERVRVHFALDAELHEALLAVAGKERCSMTDVLNMAVSVGVPVLAFHPELIPTLRTKFVQSPKNNNKV